jgi:hypothetical protein
LHNPCFLSFLLVQIYNPSTPSNTLLSLHPLLQVYVKNLKHPGMKRTPQYAITDALFGELVCATDLSAKIAAVMKKFPPRQVEVVVELDSGFESALDPESPSPKSAEQEMIVTLPASRKRREGRERRERPCASSMFKQHMTLNFTN